MADQSVATKTAASAPAAAGNNNILYLVAYVLSLLGGILVYIMAGTDQRLKKHAVQAICFGVIWVLVYIINIIVVTIIVGSALSSAYAYGYSYNLGAIEAASSIGWIFTLIYAVVWLVGLYVGWQAYNGVDVNIPVITPLAEKYSK